MKHLGVNSTLASKLGRRRAEELAAADTHMYPQYAPRMMEKTTSRLRLFFLLEKRALVYIDPAKFGFFDNRVKDSSAECIFVAYMSSRIILLHILKQLEEPPTFRSVTGLRL